MSCYKTGFVPHSTTKSLAPGSGGRRPTTPTPLPTLLATASKSNVSKQPCFEKRLFPASPRLLNTRVLW